MNQMIADKLMPLGSRILVRSIVPQKKTKSGILLPESHKDAVKTGSVVAVGPGELNEGKLIPVSIKVGETVVMPEYGGTKFKEGEAEYVLLRESELLAKMSE
eukprot:Mrub_15129.p2 GENE.Mrub_15129~~Mrub_15129.p2  ORF type:complete len:112 (+),score=8.00 Mrub_15129:32-337(+)